MPTAPTLDELINAANWMYYQSPNQLPADLVPLVVNGAPVTSNPAYEADGLYGEAFFTPSGQVVVAFEGTNTDMTSPAYNTTFSNGSLAADEKILLKAAPGSIAAMTDATSFMQTVAADASSLGIGQSSITVTGHSLGAAIASYVSYADGYTGVGFATPGLNFGTAGTGSFSNYVVYGDAVGNFSSQPPNPEGALTSFPSGNATHYGTVDYLGTASNQSYLVAGGYMIDGFAATFTVDSGVIGAKLLLGAAEIYHPLANYAAALGVTLTNTTPGTTVGTVSPGMAADAAGDLGLSSSASGASLGGLPLPATAAVPFSQADLIAVSGVINALQPTAQVVASLYNSANTDNGFAAATAGSSNIAFLDPANTTTTSSGTTYLDPSGTYTVPSGYQAMVATGNFSYTMIHQAGGTAMRLVANAGLDTVVSAVSGDTVQAGTGYLYDVQQSGALTFLGGGNASTVFGGVGTTTYYGGAGNDLVVGGTGGGTLLAGGAGSDTLVGGGAGSVFGGSGSAVIFGGTGDLLVAGAGNTTLLGGQNDRVYLGAGADTVFGAAGDSIVGGSGTAVAVLGGGGETVLGGAGSAVVFGGAGALDMVLGGGGAAVVAGSGTATFNAVSGTTAGNTVIFGFSGANDQLAFSGYGAGQVTQSVVNGSLVVNASGATITLVGVTTPNASA